MWFAALALGVAAAEPPLVDRVHWTPEGLSSRDRTSRGVDVDGRGNVWIATQRGVAQWDGERTTTFTRRDGGASDTWGIRAEGDIVVANRFNRELLELVDGALVPVSGADGKPLVAEKYLVDAQGLWVFEPGFGLRRRDPDGTWIPYPIDDLGPALGWSLNSAPGGGVVLGTLNHGLWEVRSDGTHRHTVERGRVWDAAFYADGRMIALIDRGPWIVHPDGRAERVGFHALRSDETEVGDPRRFSPVTVAVVGQSALYGSGQHLDQLLPDGSVVRTLAERSLLSGVGDLTPDAEGNLWFGTSGGVGRIAEPRTWIWNERTGLAGPSQHELTVDGDRIWVATYSGFSVIERAGDAWEARRILGVEGVDAPCVDGSGGVWAIGHLDSWAGPRGWIRLDLDPPQLARPVEGLATCAVGGEGRIWLAGEDQVLEVDGNGVLAGPYPGSPVPHVTAAAETSDGRVWIAGGTRICSAAAASLRAKELEPWACRDLPEHVGPNIRDLRVPEPGALWAETEGDGLWALGPDGVWGPHASFRDQGLDPAPVGLSPRGGVWVNDGGPRRYEERDGVWTEVEALGEAVGLTGERFRDITETEDGDVWVVTYRHVARVPREARSPDLDPPTVAWTRIVVDGQVAPPGPLDLPPTSPSVELAFSAHSARAPRSLQYRFRMDDGRWSEPFDDPALRFAGLEAGSHRVQVAATLDGRSWSEPTELAIRVATPWYRRPWFLGLVIVAVGGIAAGLQRARTASRVRRMALQSRIAMDLHDELGAGLGSIRILAGMATDRASKAGLSPDLTRRIEDNAADLASALTDIVWSLRPSSGSLEALALYMADRGRDLFAGHETRFRTRFPTPLPKAPMALGTSRHAQLILLEALHNAARHARAANVSLALESRGGRWVFSVTDDGIGLDGGNGPRTGGGGGLGAMEARAEAISAELRVSTSSEGTAIALVLPADLLRE